MTAAAYVISILLQLVFPAALVFFIIHRFSTGWKFAILGAMAYMASSLLHSVLLPILVSIDMYNGIIAAGPIYWILILFFFAGLMQQLARWVSFRFSGGPGTTWQQTLTMGAGFGGFELIMLLLNSQLLTAFISAIQFTSTGGAGMNIPPDQLTAFQGQVQAFLTKPFLLVLLEALPGLSGLVLQFALAAMAWVAIRSRSYLWHAGAVLWMTMFSTVGIIFTLWNNWAAPVNGVYPSEGAIALMGFLGLILVNLVFLYVFYYKIIPLVEEIPVPVQPVIVPAKARNAPPEEPKLPANEKKNRPVKPVKLPKNNE